MAGTPPLLYPPTKVLSFNVGTRLGVHGQQLSVLP